QKKRTFTLPWEEWLRGALRPRIEESLASLAPALGAHLHTAGVRMVWGNFLHGQTTWSRTWSLYVLNEWCRRHLCLCLSNNLGQVTIQASDASTERVFPKGSAGTSCDGTSRGFLLPDSDLGNMAPPIEVN